MIVSSIGPRKPEDGENAYLKIQMVVTPFKDRGQGIATAFFKDLVAEAKRNKIDVFLTPDDSYQEPGDMTKKDLVRWYKKLGFEPKHKDDFRSQDTLCFYA